MKHIKFRKNKLYYFFMLFLLFMVRKT